MKKIASAMILFLFLLPVTVSAQSADEIKQEKIRIITQLISLLQQELALLISMSETPASMATSTPETPITVGTPAVAPTPVNNTPSNPPPIPQVVCSLTAESNTGAPATEVKVTWSSDNATSGVIRNNRAAVKGITIPSNQVQAGSMKVMLSSEVGEMNTIEAVFTGPGGVVVCQTQVLTQ